MGNAGNWFMYLWTGVVSEVLIISTSISIGVKTIGVGSLNVSWWNAIAIAIGLGLVFRYGSELFKKEIK